MEKFKLHLAPDVDLARASYLCVLPNDKTAVQLAADYLRGMAAFALVKLSEHVRLLSYLISTHMNARLLLTTCRRKDR